MFYSKSTGGFYTIEIHGDSIPSDAVEITATEHSVLLQGQSQGQRIQADENGYPFLADQPTLNEEELQVVKNQEARAYLASTDWYVIRNQETGVAIPEEIAIKRQEAREQIIEAQYDNLT